MAKLNHKAIALTALIVGLAVAGFMMYVGLAHNPQGEFCLNPGEVECQIDWPHLLSLGLFWLVPVFALCYLVLALVNFIYKTVRS